MKRLLLIASIITSISVSACTCQPFLSFCETKAQFPHDITFYGTIISSDSLKIRLEKISIVDGTELRDTITVWNDIMLPSCDSMLAKNLGNVGDTLLILLNKIDSVKNSWDVVNDYRTPFTTCQQSVLIERNDTLRGLINQVHNYPNLPPVFNFYTNNTARDVIAFIQSNNGDCTPIRDTTFDYIPFPKSNAGWKVSYRDGHSNFCSHEIYTYMSDTMINNTLYQKLKHDSLYGTYMANSSCNINGKVTQYIFYRNDSTKRKVYFKTQQSGSPKDTIGYDFNLEVGDTLPKSLIHNYSNLTIDSIDFIYLQNRFRRRYFIDYSTGAVMPLILIEGIGSSMGLINDFSNGYPSFCCFESLDCITINGNSEMLPTSLGNCAIVSGLANRKRFSFQSHPNPTDGLINLETTLIIKNIEIYDINGRLVIRMGSLPKISRREDESTINQSQFSLPEKKGLYYLKIQTEEGEVFTEKVIRK